LKGPTKHIAYIITVIYLVSIGGFVANLEWFNQNLPTFGSFIDQPLVSLNSPNVLTGRAPHVWEAYSSHNSTAAPIIALLQVGSDTAPAIINGILIYAGISTANTALYVASRTLYGLTRDLSSTSENIMVRIFAKLNTVSPTTRIPVWALIISCLAFACWTPWINITSFTSTKAKDVSNQ
jgi:amino acid transporter